MTDSQIPMHDDITPEAIDQELQNVKEPGPFRKALFIFIGLFLIILVIVGFILAETLTGIIGSIKLADNQISHPEATITFTEDALAELQHHYTQNEHREIKACLQGRINVSYIIDTVVFPPVNHASVVHINTPRCPEDTLIDLHSHPVRRCLASEQDVRVYKSLLPAHPNLLMLIMCSTERFSVYTSQNT